MKNENNNENSINKYKNDLIIQLPIYLSKIIFTEWVDVKDICFFDQSYCNKKYRKKIIEILNNLLIDGKEINDFE